MATSIATFSVSLRGTSLAEMRRNIESKQRSVAHTTIVPRASASTASSQGSATPRTAKGAANRVRLGDSDLMVSECCLGTMTWGNQNTEAEAHAQLSHAILDCGLNFIDTAGKLFFSFQIYLMIKYSL
jgi:hypothetical protein